MASTTVGVSAWFAPAPAQPIAVAVAMITAVAGVALINETVRRHWPLVLWLGATAALTPWSVWVAIAAAAAGVVLAAAGTVIRTWLVISNSTKAIRWSPGAGRGGGFVSRWLHAADERRSAVTAQLASLNETARAQACSLAELERQNHRLQAMVEQLHTELIEADRRNRRSSLLSFWGGIAFSIPIGVAINLATA